MSDFERDVIDRLARIETRLSQIEQEQVRKTAFKVAVSTSLIATILSQGASLLASLVA